MATGQELAQEQIAKDLTLKALEGFTVGSVKSYDPAEMGKFVGILYTAILNAVAKAPTSGT